MREMHPGIQNKDTTLRRLSAAEKHKVGHESVINQFGRGQLQDRVPLERVERKEY